MKTSQISRKSLALARLHPINPIALECEDRGHASPAEAPRDGEVDPGRDQPRVAMSKAEDRYRWLVLSLGARKTPDGRVIFPARINRNRDGFFRPFAGDDRDEDD